MGSEFATKLRITAAALGCPGRKDLCARFRAVNPATHFDLERSHKWMQGRSLPRSAQIYDDWAKVLGTKRPGAWLASCTVASFLEEVSALYDAEAASLLARAGQDHRDDHADAARPAAHGQYLCGAYACYSLAWSPYHRGQLMRGTLLVDTGRRNTLSVSYSEAPLGAAEGSFGGPTRWSGSFTPQGGRTVNVSLNDPAGASPLFMSLYRPGPPASVLCGMLSGSAEMGTEPRPSACRLAVVRVPGEPASTNRYMNPAHGALAADLRTLGLCLPEAEDLDEVLHNFLLGSTGGPDQVAAAEQARLAAMLDRAWLETSRVPNGPDGAVARQPASTGRQRHISGR
jgi:hypothetical protein